MNVRCVVGLCLALTAAGHAGLSSLAADDGSRSSEDHAQLIRKNTSTFLSYANEKTDKLRLLLRRGQRAEAVALESKLRNEECRFLERMVWCCNRDQSLKKAATGIQGYLDEYKSISSEQSLRDREASHFGVPKSFTAVMTHLSGPDGSATKDAAPGAEKAPEASTSTSGPSNVREVSYGKAGKSFRPDIKGVPAAPEEPPSTGGADAGSAGSGAGSGTSQ